ncbi:MAG: electron transfer flavoprotein subunit alpha/FixB family protein [Chloroflexi bacterium]|nr:electron transfer flavoprotein subunit alpha/FixB family protein [Chloroflexota bacterium]
MPEHVLVLINVSPGATLRDADREALGAARALAAARGVPVACALIGHEVAAAAAEAAERGADRVLTADAPSLVPFAGERFLPVAADAIRVAEARIVLVPRGPDLLEFVPRLAARLDGASVIGVVAVRAEEGDVTAVATAFGGAAHAVYRFRAPGPRVLALAPAVAEAPERVAGRTVTPEPLTVSDVLPRVEVVTPAAPLEGPRLEDARVVVSGGRGLGAADRYALIRELAAALGGMAGASRAIVDDAWASPAQQVGLTGKIVTPDLYFAIGISGASQHMAGCSNARCLVAVNTDPQAPIFRYAHYGIVGDCLEVLPELIRIAGQSGEPKA